MTAEVIFQKKAKKMEESIFSFFVRNGHMAILIIFGLFIGGIYAVSKMPIESEPEVKIPIATVVTVYPGASPSDIEKLVTDEIEEKISNLDDVKEITSESRDGVSAIIVEFDADADLDETIRDLRDEVDIASSDLPDDANDPVVEQIKISDRAIATFTLVGDAPLIELKKYADELQDKIESIHGVSSVEVSGLPDIEMQVFVNRQALEGYQLSIANVTSAISRNHLDIPIGSIHSDNLYYQTSLKGQFYSYESLENLAILNVGDQTVKLKDIAEVREVFSETSSESLLYEVGDTEKRAITFSVFKKVGADLVKITEEAKDIVSEYEEENLSNGTRIIITDDESERIWKDIWNLLRSAIQTVIIIGIVLFLALGGSEAISASISIPLLYLLSFIALWFIGSTFNFLTFFALILSLGVVVDTSIVITEGVHEHMKDYGMKSREAVLASLAAFSSPLISGSATTIAAFLPLALMTGIMGEYVKHIPITVNITLLASLFVALFILPVIAAFLLRNEHLQEDHKPPKLEPVFNKIRNWYEPKLNKILNSRAIQKRWMIALPVLFVISLSLFPLGILKFNLFTSIDIDIFFVNIETPEGTDLETTKIATKEAEEIVKSIPELERYTVVYGSNGSNKSRINVTLTDPSDRKRKSYDIVDDIRREFAGISSAAVRVEELESGPPSGADIEMRLIGENIKELEQFASVVKKELIDIVGTTDVLDDLELSPGEFHIDLKRDRMEYFGVSAQEIGLFLRASVFGDNSVKINKAGEEIPIVVRMDFRDKDCLSDSKTALLEKRDSVTLCRSNPKDISEIRTLLVPTKRGQVPLSEIVDVSLASAVTTIRHFNTDRVVSVKASVLEGVILQDILSELRSRLSKIEMPEYIEVQYGGENEDTTESMESLASASLLAILIVFTILVYQFHSFKQVAVVMATMPLAIMGVLYGLTILRMPMSFPGMIGLVALLGIVVNDAIVMIDKINVNRNDVQLPLKEAVFTGSSQRLEPVLMTTITTALGVLPLIFTGEAFRDIAIVVSIGITIATVFTLFVIPILYYRLESGEKGVIRIVFTKIFKIIINLLKRIFSIRNIRIKK